MADIKDLAFGKLWNSRGQEPEEQAPKSLSPGGQKKNGLSPTQKRRDLEGIRSLENLKSWPYLVRDIFYRAVKGLNKYDRDRGDRLSPLNGAIAAELAWDEFDKERNR
jgi:hypothetical protein